MGQYNLEHFLMWAGLTWSSPAIKKPFLAPWTPGYVPGMGKNGPEPCSPMHWGVIWRTRHFPGGPVQPGAAQPFWSCSSHKMAIFGPLDPWIGAWKWQKRVPHQ